METGVVQLTNLAAYKAEPKGLDSGPLGQRWDGRAPKHAKSAMKHHAMHPCPCQHKLEILLRMLPDSL